MSVLFDVHTHRKTKAVGVLSIEQCTLDDQLSQCNSPFSISIHPWDIHKGYDVERLQLYASHPNCVAIGETGLDKLSVDFKLQERVFLEHIAVAKRVKKPIILHCVKAFEECLVLLEQTKFLHGVVFHGFNKHPNLAGQLIKKGYYISLGAFFLKENPNFERFLIQSNFKGILFETDNDTSMKVSELYQKAKRIHPKLDITKTLTETFNNWKEQ